jgi:ribosomal protein S3
MAGNPKTPKSAKATVQTTPGSKGVKVGVNKAATLPGNKTQSSAVGMKKKK